MHACVTVYACTCDYGMHACVTVFMHVCVRVCLCMCASRLRFVTSCARVAVVILWVE